MHAIIAALLLVVFAAPAFADDAAARRELLPTGKLRVGIGVGQAMSAFWTVRDPSGQPRGVTVALGQALAQKLGVPLELVAYNSSSEVVDAGERGQWDASFIPFDAERARKIDFGPNYYLFTRTYMVPAGSTIRTIAEVDRPGIRVGGVANTTTLRSAERALKQAQIVGAGCATARSMRSASAARRSKGCCPGCPAPASSTAISTRPVPPSPCRRASPRRLPI